MATDIKTELTRIKQAKSDIRSAIESKGVEVDPRATIDKYAEYIKEIPSTIELETLTITSNGTYTAETGRAYREVTANVQIAPVLQDLTITKNGTYTAEAGYDGLGTVSVNVQGGGTEPNYFYLEDVSGSDNPVSITGNSSAESIEVFCSTDGENWQSIGSTSDTAITATIPANGKLYLKATATTWNSHSISPYDKFNVGGNIMSIIYGDEYQGKYVFPNNSTNTFSGMFRDSNVVSAGDLVLPALIVPENGYSWMFWRSTSLTTAPELPARYIYRLGYWDMFGMCESLTTPPSELPANTEAWQDQYQRMFEYCTALTEAPVLKSPNWGDTVGTEMFIGCTSLNKVVSYASSAGSNSNWLSNVAANGDFFNLGGATYTKDSPDGIPSGWTEHTSL